MKHSEIKQTMERFHKLMNTGTSYLGSDKEKAKFYFRLAEGEIQKFQNL